MVLHRCCLGLLLAASCHASGSAPSVTPTTGAAHVLDPGIPGWLPENRARLDALLASRGIGGDGFVARALPHRDPSFRDW